MTILNIIVAPNRVAIVADTAANDGSLTSKALGLPYLPAITGALGSLDVWLDWSRFLPAGLPAGTTIADLSCVAHEFLRERWERTELRAPPPSCSRA